jgi:serine/threonine protein kinase/DNA-binding CsgD family transcriptional regulator
VSTKEDLLRTPSLSEVRDRYRAGDLVLFVGAGLSTSAGLPSWKALVVHLLDRARARGIALAEIENLIEKEQFIDALAATELALGTPTFEATVKAALDDRHTVQALPELGHAIAALAPRLRAVLTTNLDHLIERAFQGRWPAFHRANGNIGQERGVILKLHGTLLQSDTWVMTRSQYSRAMYNDPQLTDAVSTFFHGRTLLFIGYGLADDDFDQVLARIQTLSRGNKPRHFALIKLAPATSYWQKKREDAGVELISYVDHADVPKILRWLADECPTGEDAHSHDTFQPASGAPTILDSPPPQKTISNTSLEREPHYDNGELRALSLRLADARRRKFALGAAQQRVDAVDLEILELRRQLRKGGQVHAGDDLNGRYLLLECIGRGGFGSVWRALDRSREQSVAIKLLHPDLARHLSSRERFFRGARVMSSLQHKNIVRVLESKREDDGYLYFVMEYIDGWNLHDAIQNKRLRKEQAMLSILQIGAALSYAHQMSVIHRDVKPSNILVDRDGHLRLTDFDLVKLDDTTGGTRTGGLGSHIYAAPEQLSHAGEADARADVYGLGMTATFCFHGCELPPHTFRRPESVINSLDCALSIKRILIRAVSLDPADRFKDAQEFCDALSAQTSASEAEADERLTAHSQIASGHSSSIYAFDPPVAPGSLWEAALESDVSTEPFDDLAQVWEDFMAQGLSGCIQAYSPFRSHLVARVVEKSDLRRSVAITRIERAIVARVICGEQQKLIAYELGIAVSTASRRYTQALAKLQLEDTPIPLSLAIAGQNWTRGTKAKVDSRRAFFQYQGSGFCSISVPRPRVPDSSPLTSSERLTAELIIEGRSRLEIAKATGTSAQTVALRLRGIFNKLRASGRYQLIDRSVELGWLR